MRTAAPRKGLDHDIPRPASAGSAAALLLAALTAASPPLPASAQAAPPCTAIEDDAERLACYDRALRSPAPPAPVPSAATPSAEPQPAAAAPAATSTAPAASAEQSGQRRIRGSAAPVAPSAPAAGAADDDDEGIVPIVIIRVRALPGREAIFTAQDGATWVQTDSQRLGNLPDTPFDAELKPGSMGSVFLVPKDQGRAIRVRNAAR